MIQAGKLRNPIQLQTLVETRNTNTGQAVQSWIDADFVWGSIEPATGREQMLASQLQTYVSHKIIIRWLPGVDPTMRAIFNSRAFDFVSVTNYEERNIYWTIMAVESVTVQAVSFMSPSIQHDDSDMWAGIR